MADSIISTPVIVPHDFVGVCVGNSLAAPGGIKHNVVRNWDYKGTNGANSEAIMTLINPSAGTYNWSTFDQLFTNNADKEIIFCLGTPPDYLVSRAAVGGSYRGAKGNMCPDDLSAWAAAVQAVVSRAKNTFGRTGVKWELWNEIDQTSCYNDTASLLGPYTKTTAQAIRAIDPTAVILGPSIAGSDSPKLTVSSNYIKASDGSGGTSATWLDGVSLHYYNQLITQRSAFENPVNYVNAYKNFQGAMAEAGCRLPVWVTESGVIAADTDGWRAYQRRLLTWAALGARCVLLYQYDSSNYPMSGYVGQLNTVYDLLAEGSVISSCEIGMAKMAITINGQQYVF